MGTFSAQPSWMRPRHRSRSIRKYSKPYTRTFAHIRPKHARNTVPRSRRTISKQSPLGFVYVGNLRPDVRVADLEQLFTRSGKVTRVDIRCCSGSVVPSNARGGTVYATVLFASVEEATHALALDGNALLGNKIVVTASFLGLPEAKQSIDQNPIQICGVDFTKISDTLHRAVDKIWTGGTRVFPLEGA